MHSGYNGILSTAASFVISPYYVFLFQWPYSSLQVSFSGLKPDNMDGSSWKTELKVYLDAKTFQTPELFFYRHFEGPSDLT